MIGKELPEETKDLPFPDADEISDWARESVEVMYTWGILQGREDGSFGPQRLLTREQCLITFLRLYENAPVSRKNENVEPLFTYDQIMEMLEKFEYGDGFYYQEMSRWEGPTATLIREASMGPVIRPTTTFFVYRDGRCRFFDIGLCNIHGRVLSSSVHFNDGAFSQDGSTFTFTAVLEDDSVLWGENLDDAPLVLHPAGLYHITVDVETLEVTQEWEPLPT